LGIRLQIVTRSLWIHPVVAGGCNGCHLEILACLGPKYDLERFGVRLAPSPNLADALLVSGSLIHPDDRRLKRMRIEMSGPNLVLAVGTCALDQGFFRGGPVQMHSADSIFRVDMHIPGCPPKPEAVIAGFGKLIRLIRQNPDT
jgi:membrane-bound hydrogenase subunit mbhJ